MLMAEKRKGERKEGKGPGKGTVAGGGVKTETVIILVAAAFFLGLIVGVVGVVLKTSPVKEVQQLPPQRQREIPLSPQVDLSQEIQMLEERVQNDPGNPDAWSQLGDVFYRDQRYDNAVEAYTKALNLRPARTDVLIKLGNAHFDRGANEGAIEAYSKALSIDPKNADVLTDLGIAYRRAGNPNRAVEAFRKAAQMDANHLNSRYNLGVVLFHDLNDKEGAIRAWEDFLQVEPKGERAEQVKRMVETLRNMSSSQ